MALASGDRNSIASFERSRTSTDGGFHTTLLLTRIAPCASASGKSKAAPSVPRASKAPLSTASAPVHEGPRFQLDGLPGGLAVRLPGPCARHSPLRWRRGNSKRNRVGPVRCGVCVRPRAAPPRRPAAPAGQLRPHRRRSAADHRRAHRHRTLRAGHSRPSLRINDQDHEDFQVSTSSSGLIRMVRANSSTSSRARRIRPASGSARMIRTSAASVPFS